MSYIADFYKLEKDEQLTFLFHVSGSDASQYFEDVKSWKEINNVFVEKQNDYDTWTSERWSNPWKTSKISDDVVVFEEVTRKWFEFWKPKTSIVVWLKTYHEKGVVNDDTKMWFSSVEERYKNHNSDFDNEEDFIFNEPRLFNLPIMK